MFRTCVVMMLPFAASAEPEVLGVRLIGLTPDVGRKVLLSAVFVVALVVIVSGLSFVLKRIMHRHERPAFWAQQFLRLVAAIVLVLGLISIWVTNPGSLATGAGLLTAGVAVALQRVITAFAGYLIILRGKSFTIGDRITMGGVRGDVVALGFMQTTVMEMGEAPGEHADAPATWVGARQYTGRIVRVTNDRIFDSPVYNYTREFPFVWDEMRIPISYRDDRARAEQILLDVARRRTASIVEEGGPALGALTQRYPLPGGTDIEPRVYYALTDNWVELTLRFLAPVRGVRGVRDALSRDIIDALDQARIGIASSTYDIVGVPPIRVEMMGTHPESDHR